MVRDKLVKSVVESSEMSIQSKVAKIRKDIVESLSKFIFTILFEDLLFYKNA